MSQLVHPGTTVEVEPVLDLGENRRAEAAATLYTLYRQRIHEYCRGQLRERQDADAALQERARIEKGRLQRVVRIVHRAEHAIAVPVQPSPKQRYQTFEGLLIAGLRRGKFRGFERRFRHLVIRMLPIGVARGRRLIRPARRVVPPG